MLQGTSLYSDLRRKYIIINSDLLFTKNFLVYDGRFYTIGEGHKEFTAYLMQNKEIAFTFQRVNYRIRITGAVIYPQGFAAISEFSTKMKDVLYLFYRGR